MWWNTTDTSRTEYEVEFFARLGKAVTTFSDAPEVYTTAYRDGAQDLEEWYTYGALSSSGDQDLYRIVFPRECADTFEVQVKGFDGHDLDFYLSRGDPSDLGYNTGLYDVEKTGPDSTEYHKEEVYLDPDDDNVQVPYSLLVEHEGASLSDYEVLYSYEGCAGTGGGPQEVGSHKFQWNDGGLT